MQKLFAVELLFVVILLFIYGGKSLKCFECRSDLNEECNEEGVNKSFSVNCTAKPNVSKMYCRVIKQKLKFKGEQDYTFIRECAYEKAANPCYYLKWIDIAFQETCECTGDLCNRGDTLLPNFRLYIVSFSLWIIMYLTKR